MKIIAKQTNIRTSPRKLRLVVEAIKALKPTEALVQLKFTPKFAAEPVAKVIKQAMANATNNHQISVDQLKISEILVDAGPTIKRWRAVSRGRAHSIFKRTSQIQVILESVAPKVVAASAPVVAKNEKVAKPEAKPKKTTAKKPTKITKTKK